MLDAVVLGAGFTGSAAALRCAEHGLKVLVVEARARVGGRAYSRAIAAELPDPVEFGGSWLTARHHRLRHHAARLGIGLRAKLPIIERRCEAGQGHPVAGSWSDAGLAAIRDDALGLIGRRAAAMDFNKSAPISLAGYMDALRLSPAARREVLAWWTVTGSADPDKVGAGALLWASAVGDGSLDSIAADYSHTVEGGAQGLVAAMLRDSGATVVLGDAAVSIDATKNPCAVQLASGRTIAARTVICTLPINALGAVRFSPDLSAAARSFVKSGHHGRVLKVLMAVEDVAPGALVTGEQDGFRLMLTERALSDGRTLVIGFGLHDEVADRAPSVLQRALSAFFPGARLVAADFHDWVKDPWSAGTWVSPGIGQDDMINPDFWADLGRVAFASSDFSGSEAGWFEGGIRAGEAAADRVVATLQTAKDGIGAH